MGRNSYRSLLILALSLFAAASPLPPAEVAYRQAARLAAAGDWNVLETFTTEALKRIGSSGADEVWGVRAYLAVAMLGKAQTAQATALLALDLPPHLVTSEIGVRWITYRACAAYRNAQYAEAERLLDFAEQTARKTQHAMLPEVLLYRANCEFVRKDAVPGLRYARASIREARKYGNRRIEIKALGTVALLSTMQGRFSAAIAANREAVAAAKAIGDDSTLQKTEGNLAWAYMTIGEYDIAYDTFLRVLALSRRLGAARDSVVWINQVADVARLRHDYPTALRNYRQGISLARQSKHLDLAEFLVNLGVAQLETGDLAGARASVAEALKFNNTSDEQSQRALLLDSRLDAATGAIDEAIIKCRRVIAAKSSKTLQWEAQGRLAQMYLAANNPDAAEKEFIRAIDTAAEVRKSIDKEELRLPFGSVVREVYDAYIDFMVSNRTASESLLAAERSRARTLEEALQTTEQRAPIDVQRIARDHNAVVLAFWFAPSRSFLWAVTGSSVDVMSLPASSVVEKQVDAYAKQLATLATPDAALQKRGSDLFSILVGPAQAQIAGATRIIVIPDGRLHAFNLETLVVPKTRRYWIEDVTITTSPSLELLARPRPATTASSMLVFGDPPSPDPEFPRLRNGADEIRRVAAHFRRPTIIEGANATPAAYQRSGADSFEFIHFVAHGIATRQVPLDSAVVLARDRDDFKLYARDILRQPLRASLVTISSCHGAGTRSYTGEGLVGLAWAFLHAGARQVIAALWEVDEAATPQLMDDLYTHIHAGDDPATALRAAKLRLVHSSKLHRRPFYWAPFVLYSGS